MKILQKLRIADVVYTATVAFIFVALGTIWVTWGRSGPDIATMVMSLHHSELPNTKTLADQLAEPTHLAGAMERSGQWGDGFGPLNTLFTGLAFTGTLLALYLQGKALIAQRKDLHQQRFETTFFELLALLRTAREEVRFRHSSRYRSAIGLTTSSSSYGVQMGNAAFRRAAYEIRYWLRPKAIKIAREPEALGTLYKRSVHAPFESTLGAYFRILYTILKKIHEDPNLPEEEKIKYANILRGQMTSFEVTIAAFNAFMPEANDLDALLIRFRMLKYLPQQRLREILEGIYPDVAFRGRGEADLSSEPGDVLLGFLIGGVYGVAFGLLVYALFDRWAGVPAVVVLGFFCASIGGLLAARPRPSKVAFQSLTRHSLRDDRDGGTT
jgi:hypothetical protein